LIGEKIRRMVRQASTALALPHPPTDVAELPLEPIAAPAFAVEYRGTTYQPAPTYAPYPVPVTGPNEGTPVATWIAQATMPQPTGNPCVDSFHSPHPVITPYIAPPAPIAGSYPSFSASRAPESPVYGAPMIDVIAFDRLQGAPGNQVETLRATAHALEQTAHELECRDLFERADQVRQLAEQLRQDSRELKKGSATSTARRRVVPSRAVTPRY
jgi:hypothetical protein